MDCKKLGLIIIAIIELVIIIFLYLSFEEYDKSHIKETYIFTEVSPDKEYKIDFYEIGTTYPLGSSKVGIYVTCERASRQYITIEVYNEGTATKENFNIQWTEEGAIINVTQCDAPDMAYRVYWDDVFGTRTEK